MNVISFLSDKWLTVFIRFSVPESSFNIHKDERRAYVVVDDFSTLATPHSKISITQFHRLLVDTLITYHDASGLKWSTKRRHREMIKFSSWLGKQMICFDEKEQETTDLVRRKKARNSSTTRFLKPLIYNLYFFIYIYIYIYDMVFNL